MFLAIRDYFARPDETVMRRGRGRRLIALFLFEFIVVVLGVLAAQLLQDRFAQRNEARRAREAVMALAEESANFLTIAEYRIRADECESKRIARLASLAASGDTARPDDLKPPIMPMPTITAWSDDTRSAVMRYAGAKDVRAYDLMSLYARMISERQRRLEDQWADFRLLSPKAGKLTPDGRTAVMLAASRAGGLLDAIDNNAYSMTKASPPAKETTEVMKRMSKLKHPCASAALVPFKLPAA